MASEAKKLLVGLQLDTKQGDKLTTLLKGWNKEAKDLTKTFSGLKLGNLTTSGGKNALLTQVEDTVKGLGRLGKVSQDAAKLMREGINRELEEQKDLLKDLEQAYQNAERRYSSAATKRQQMERMFGSNSLAAREASSQERSAREGYFGSFNKMQEQRTALGAAGSGGGGGVSGLLGGLLSRFGPAALLGIAANRVGNLEGDLDKLDLTNLQARAKVYGTAGKMEVARRSGDPSYALAFQGLTGSKEGQDTIERLTNSEGFRRQFGQFADSTKSMLKGGDYASAFAAAKQAGPKAMEALENVLGLYQQEHAVNFDAVNTLGGNASQRLSFGRRMGNMGTLRQGGLLQRNSSQFGFFQDEVMGVSSGILETGGRRAANDLTAKALDAITKGMSEGAAVAIAGGAAIGDGSGRILGHFAQLGASGAMDMVAAGRAGQFTAGQMSLGFGRQSGAGIASFMSGGDVFEEKFREQAMGSLGGIMSGSMNPYQGVRARLDAIRSMPKGSIYAQEALTKMDPGTMLNIVQSGEVPGWLKAMGVDTNSVRTYFDRRFSSEGDLFADQGGKDDMSRLARAFRGGTSASDVASGALTEVSGMSGDRLKSAYSAFRFAISHGAERPDVTGAMMGGIGNGLAMPLPDANAIGPDGQPLAGAKSPEQGMKDFQVGGELARWKTVNDNVISQLERLDKAVGALNATLTGEKSKLEGKLQGPAGLDPDLHTLFGMLPGYGFGMRGKPHE